MAFGYAEVAARAGHRCEYCRAPERLTNFRFFVDHVVPRVAAPERAADPENLALCCLPCNLYKADRTDAVDSATSERVRLFHPRRDRWSVHFGWSEDGLRIVGLTAVGRATIELLRMNSQAQQRTRAFWLEGEASS